MRLLVTGAGGFIGRALVRVALAAPVGDPRGPARVVGLGPRPPWPPLPSGALWETGDATDPARVADVIRRHHINAVAHLARIQRHADEAALARTHLGGALGVLLAAREAPGAPARVLIAGSAAEYGLVAEAELPIPEERPARPASAYGYAKHAESSLGLLAPATLGVPAVVARIFNPVGCGQDSSFVAASLVSQFAAMVRRGGPRAVRVDAPDVMRDFADVEDVAEALRLLLERGQTGECYNVGSGRATRVGEIITLLSDLTGIRPTSIETRETGAAGAVAMAPLSTAPSAMAASSTAPSSTAPPAACHSVAAVDKLERATGFRCRTPLRRSLEAMLAQATAAPASTAGLSGGRR